MMDDAGRDEVAAEGFANAGGLTWSPDGSRLAFWATLPGDCPSGTCTEVFALDPMDNTMECLTEQYELGGIDETTWSPDGTHIVTASWDSTAKIWRAFQTTNDLIAYARDCCVVRELTSEERAMLNLPPK